MSTIMNSNLGHKTDPNDWRIRSRVWKDAMWRVSERCSSHHASWTPAWPNARRGTRTPPRNSSPNFRLLAFHRSTLNKKKKERKTQGSNTGEASNDIMLKAETDSRWLTSVPACRHPLLQHQTASLCSLMAVSPGNGKGARIKHTLRSQ